MACFAWGAGGSRSVGPAWGASAAVEGRESRGTVGDRAWRAAVLVCWGPGSCPVSVGICGQGVDVPGTGVRCGGTAFSKTHDPRSGDRRTPAAAARRVEKRRRENVLAFELSRGHLPARKWSFTGSVRKPEVKTDEQKAHLGFGQHRYLSESGLRCGQTQPASLRLTGQRTTVMG